MIFLMAFSSVPSFPQDIEASDAVAAFLGADSAEEMDPYEVEKLNDLLDRPVKVNLASSSRLISCGLFTAYQAASLQDYRSNYGDVLSYSELEALDGFA